MSLLKAEETRVLFLKSYDINTSNAGATYYSATGDPVQTEQGIVANNRYSLTWFNVNIRQALGNTYYEKYNKFHIRLNSFWTGQISTGVAPSGPGVAQDIRSVDIYLHGLAFEPTPYAQSVASKTSNKVFMANVLLPVLGFGNPGVVYNFGDGATPSYTFSKTADNINLGINMVQATSQTAFIPGANTELYGHSTFCFEIHGFDES
jgi:hypothetical protein